MHSLIKFSTYRLCFMIRVNLVTTEEKSNPVPDLTEPVYFCINIINFPAISTNISDSESAIEKTKVKLYRGMSSMDMG